MVRDLALLLADVELVVVGPGRVVLVHKGEVERVGPGPNCYYYTYIIMIVIII